ncbi:MAG TPA: ABC transporter permease subunit [Acidimicrobiales bacterium]|nr:ABC transporter permease subunit [Acidimicrobiales bacterium]
MAALSAPRVATARAHPGAEFRLGAVARTGVLVVAALYFLVPLLASARYALEGAHGSYTLSSVTALFHDSVLLQSLVTSVEISLGAAAITLALLTPTSVWVNLRMPRWRRAMESITLLPLVVPVVVVVLGIYGAFPTGIVASPVLLALEYVVLAMPYSYRAIDGGVQALDLHTLVDASRSLGAGWAQVFRRVLVPNLRSSLLSAAFITVAYSLGEFAMANLLSFTTFPTELFQIGTEQVGEATAVSVFALVLTFGVLLALSLFGGRGRRRAVRTGLPAGQADGVVAELAAEVDAVLGHADPGRPGIVHDGPTMR